MNANHVRVSGRNARAPRAARPTAANDGMVAVWRDRLATALLMLCALGALASAVGAIGTVAAASPATQIVETWRLFGFVVFTGLFGLLAWRPRHYAGVWELVIAHKAGMALIGAVLVGRGAADAPTIALVDGTLALILVAAYVLAKGYTSWARLRQP